MRKLTVALTLITALSATMTLQAEPKEVGQEEELRQIVDGARSQGATRGVRGYAAGQNTPSVSAGQKRSTAKTKLNKDVSQPKNTKNLTFASDLARRGQVVGVAGAAAILIGGLANNFAVIGFGLLLAGLGFAIWGASVLIAQNKNTMAGIGLIEIGVGLGLMGTANFVAPVLGTIGLALSVAGVCFAMPRR